ncbi:uncharacterized protein AKAW2_51877S [Aspergillus luchuensis]|uniref:Uncharacterized protein n=1 Tax=Aspergillus kawachii TaxID=1069201 RepID=A0A7R7WEY1_ASPKA|nr:uncharacterized protein AKAW2_51877S [Aspergillus luchuensis]BCS01536.1 hypothetical protein AKAW2_51877S [Aspergillus luchuensis]
MWEKAVRESPPASSGIGAWGYPSIKGDGFIAQPHSGNRYMADGLYVEWLLEIVSHNSGTMPGAKDACLSHHALGARVNRAEIYSVRAKSFEIEQENEGKI